ncbi:MAG: carbon-nitrogen hydrolase family protein [Armatimonadota bacterium]
MALPIHIAAVQYSSEAGNRVDDQDKAIHMLDDAAHVSDLVVLPESSFSCHWLDEDISKIAVPVNGPLISVVSQIAVIRNTFICCNIVERDGDLFYNSTVMISADGNVIGTYRKINISSDEINAGFSAGKVLKIFRTHLGSIGVLSYEDLNDLSNIRILHEKDVQIVLVPCSAWYRESDDPSLILAKWENKLRANAIQGRCHIVWANKIGTERGLNMLGCSMIVSPDGEIIQTGSADKEEVVRSTVTLQIKGTSTGSLRRAA